MTVNEMVALSDKLKECKKLAKSEKDQKEEWMRIKIDFANVLIDSTIEFLNIMMHRQGYHHFKGQHK